MYIGIDCGTQGIKVIIWDGDDKLLASGYKSYPLMSSDSGRKEQEVSWWLDGLIDAMHIAFEKSGVSRSSIKGIGVSGQQHGLVMLDKLDNVIRPAKLWCDTEPADAFNDFVCENRVDFSHLIGINVPVAYTIAKLVWTKNNKPKDFDKIAKIMLPHDYINYWLTGNYLTEAGDASGTGYFNTRSKRWSDTLLEFVSLPDSASMPALIESQQCHGQLRPKIAKKLGLPESVVVSSGGGDNMMAAIGTGNVSTGILTMSLGTSGTVFSHTYKQVESEAFPDLNAFCSSTNGYLPLASTMNVTSATTAFRHLLNTDIPTFEKMISQASLGASGVQVMPYLAGARLPNIPKAKGAILGLTSDNFSQQNLLRGAVEGVTFNLAKGVNVLSEAGLNFTSLRLIGGGSNSATWRQIVADVTGLVVEVPESSEAAALGAAMQAKWAYSSLHSNQVTIEEICALGVKMDTTLTAEPIQSNVQRYNDLYQEYHQQAMNYIKPFC